MFAFIMNKIDHEECDRVVARDVMKRRVTHFFIHNMRHDRNDDKKSSVK